MASPPRNKNNPFTDLPDCMIHHILSFLDNNNVESFRLVSKRFHEACLPYLSFVSKRCRRYNLPNYCNLFYDRLEKFLRDRRTHNSDIIRLHIDWNCNSDHFHEIHSELVMDFIRDSVKLNVEELDLRLPKQFTLPLSMLNHESLTVLAISCDYVSPFEFVFPSLRVLSLTGSFRNADEYDSRKLSEMISYSFPSLKKLCLLNLWDPEFILTNSTLEELTISISENGKHGFGTDDLFDVNIFTTNVKTLSLDLPGRGRKRRSDNIVKIIAPKLDDFTFKAGLGGCEFEGEFESLHKASLELPNHCNYLLRVHRNVTRARCLETNFRSFEILFEDDQCRQVLIENLHNLVLKVDDNYDSKDDCIASIIDFLKQLVNLKSITIKHHRRYRYRRLYEVKQLNRKKVPLRNYDINSEHIEPQDLTCLDSLKEVVIELTSGTKEMEVVEYLLKFARNLERATVFYADDLFLMVSRIDARNFEITSKKMEFLFLQKELVSNKEDDFY